MEKNETVFPVLMGRDLQKELLEAESAVLQRETISDREEAYAISRIYDRILDVLMEDQETWKAFRSLYWQKKYDSYSKVCALLDEALKPEFLTRMGHEFKRAVQLGQIIQEDFEAAQWKMIQTLSDRACGYTGTRALWKRVSPRIPGWLRIGISSAAESAVKIKRKMVGGSDES